MLIEGTIRSKKTSILIDNFAKLINEGVSADEILVLCLNSSKRQFFTDSVLEKISRPAFGALNIKTFFGLVHSAVLDNWPIIENEIKSGDTKIIPNMCGLELSRDFLSKSIKISGFKDYFSKVNLLHQLFRRNQLRVMNMLSDEEFFERSKILGESFYDDAEKACNNYRKISLKYRSFDYLRQISLFPVIYKNTDYFKNIKYLFVDDADEMTYAELEFIKYLTPNLKDKWIAYDKKGASRCGFLSAYRSAVFEFEKIFNEKPYQCDKEDFIKRETDNLYKNIINKKPADVSFIKYNSYVRRFEMLDEAFGKIQQLLSDGAKLSDISIVTPVMDDMFISFLNRSFASEEDYQIISGSQKLGDNRFLKCVFTLIKIVFPALNLPVEVSEYRLFIQDILKIPVKYSKEVVEGFFSERKVIDYSFPDNKYQNAYNKFRDFVSKNFEGNLSSFLTEIYHFCSESINKKDLEKFNFFIKEIKSFENAYGEMNTEEKRKIISQFENGIISENPAGFEKIDENAVVIGTPQKIIDFEVKRKYNIWLDISSDLWSMRDIGTLYNAWVFNAEWEGESFTYEDNLKFSNEKYARVLRKLVLCCQKEIFAYSSVYDSSGYENFGTIHLLFRNKSESTEKSAKYTFTPRSDQKKLMEYTKGKVGVNAVPGAGKTTVLTALIIKLIQNGVSPENIFVLTYMESAASNFRDKIKSAFPEMNDLPNISTIHGLAFRIIKENNHYTRLSLPENIEIADDNIRQKLLREVIYGLNLSENDYDDYERGISAVKLSPNGIKSVNNIGKKFFRVYEEYNKKLSEKGLIDYDDMLRNAVKLISENEDIKNYYTNMCHYVIEDEAQDSSELQQKLLTLLSSKHNNFLRVGDINQAITSSFTDSDPKSFKKYFSENEKIEMTSSQRSSVQIQKLANDIIEYSLTNEDLKESFFRTKLSPAKSNPISDIPPQWKIFDNSVNERLFILNKIRELSAQNTKKSIGILLRNNYQVNEYASFLSQNGLKITLRSDILEQKTVFRLIFLYLKYLRKPFNNNSLINLMEEFKNAEIIRFSESDFRYVKNLSMPFIYTDADSLPSENLMQLWWNIEFKNNLACLSLDNAAVITGLRFFYSSTEKSNIYLIASIIKKLMNEYKNEDLILERLEGIASKPLGSSYKFFEEETSECSDIKIMTVHKSKGDEFDAVFIPELSEENYPLCISKAKANSFFVQTIKDLRIGCRKKSAEELKKEQIEETLRLIYVGVTRAKKELYLSCSKKSKRGRKMSVSSLFDVFGGEE